MSYAAYLGRPLHVACGRNHPGHRVLEQAVGPRRMRRLALHGRVGELTFVTACSRECVVVTFCRALASSSAA